MIADAERASVVAGIMGGLESEITDATTDILLEGANFSGPSIMRTAAALGLRSEASTRYEKGLDPEMIPLALDMACSLFVELCGGTVSVGTIDVRTPPRPQTVLKLRPARVAAVLGIASPPDEIGGILCRLGCEVRRDGDDFAVDVPSFRADLEREIDLIEEVARIYGLDRIPSTLPRRRVGRGRPRPGVRRPARLVEDLLAGAGLTQVITYSFVDEKWPELLRLAPDDPRRRDGAHRQPSERGAGGHAHHAAAGPAGHSPAGTWRSVRSGCNLRDRAGSSCRSGSTLPDEPTRAGILVAGRWEGDSWLRSGVTVDYFLVKGLVERLCRAASRLDVQPTLAAAEAPSRSCTRARAQSCATPRGRLVGWLGEVHPLVLQAYDLRAPAVAAELELERSARGFALTCHVPRPAGVSRRWSRIWPSSSTQRCPPRRWSTACASAGGELLENVGCSICTRERRCGPARRAWLFALSFRAPDRTLSEDEVNELRARMLEKV